MVVLFEKLLKQVILFETNGMCQIKSVNWFI